MEIKNEIKITNFFFEIMGKKFIKKLQNCKKNLKNGVKIL